MERSTIFRVVLKIKRFGVGLQSRVLRGAITSDKKRSFNDAKVSDDDVFVLSISGDQKKSLHHYYEPK